MMLAVKKLLPKLVECGDEPLGIIRIETTNPVFLVFGGDERPRWVVRFAPEACVTRTHDVLQRLGAAAPDLVPAPLASSPVDAHQWMQVQSGLPGHPWFRIKHRFATVTQWNELRESTRTALARLHVAIRTNKRWLVDVDVQAELRKSWNAARNYGLNDAQIDAAVERALAVCAGRRIGWFAQHGDFCINNLLIDAAQSRVLDFEEFGMIAMPLHDEFSLAVSLDEMAPGSAAQSLEQQVTFVMDRPEVAQAGLLDIAYPLWLHFLLWRFVTSHEIANRRSQIPRWVGLLEQSVAHGHGFLLASSL